MKDIKFKDTEVVFITTSTGQKLRIEAEIDRIFDSTTDEYQIGAINLFHDNQRNKRVEITTIDVERCETTAKRCMNMRACTDLF
jgi:hypothetical protein